MKERRETFAGGRVHFLGLMGIEEETKDFRRREMEGGAYGGINESHKVGPRKGSSALERNNRQCPWGCT